MTPSSAAGREPLPSVLRSGVRNPVQLVLLSLIRAYQLTVSPMLGPVCRFYPSCSCYGFEAIRVHGPMRGSWYTTRRLLRCHPWNLGGVDLVPPARSSTRGGSEAASSQPDSGWPPRRPSPAAEPRDAAAPGTGGRLLTLHDLPTSATGRTQSSDLGA